MIYYVKFKNTKKAIYGLCIKTYGKIIKNFKRMINTKFMIMVTSGEGREGNRIGEHRQRPSAISVMLLLKKILEYMWQNVDI